MSDGHAYCPHCRTLLLENAPYPYPVRPTRCGNCHLVVGSARANTRAGLLRGMGASGMVGRAGPRAGARAPGNRKSPVGLPVDLVRDVLREVHGRHTGPPEIRGIDNGL